MTRMWPLVAVMVVCFLALSASGVAGKYSFCSGAGCSPGGQIGKDSTQFAASINQAGGQGNTASVEINNFYGITPTQSYPGAGAVAPDIATSKSDFHLPREVALLVLCDGLGNAGYLKYGLREGNEPTGDWHFYSETDITGMMTDANTMGYTTPEQIFQYFYNSGWTGVRIIVEGPQEIPVGVEIICGSQEMVSLTDCDHIVAKGFFVDGRQFSEDLYLIPDGRNGYMTSRAPWNGVIGTVDSLSG